MKKNVYYYIKKICLNTRLSFHKVHNRFDWIKSEGRNINIVVSIKIDITREKDTFQ